MEIESAPMHVAENTSDEDSDDEIENKKFQIKVNLRRTTQYHIIAQALLATHSVVFDEIVPVLATAPSDLEHGLGMTTSQIGLFISPAAG